MIWISFIISENDFDKHDNFSKIRPISSDDDDWSLHLVQLVSKMTSQQQLVIEVMETPLHQYVRDSVLPISISCLLTCRLGTECQRPTIAVHVVSPVTSPRYFCWTGSRRSRVITIWLYISHTDIAVCFAGLIKSLATEALKHGIIICRGFTILRSWGRRLSSESSLNFNFVTIRKFELFFYSFWTVHGANQITYANCAIIWNTKNKN